MDAYFSSFFFYENQNFPYHIGLFSFALSLEYAKYLLASSKSYGMVCVPTNWSS